MPNLFIILFSCILIAVIIAAWLAFRFKKLGFKYQRKIFYRTAQNLSPGKHFEVVIEDTLNIKIVKVGSNYNLEVFEYSEGTYSIPKSINFFDLNIDEMINKYEEITKKYNIENSRIIFGL